MRKAVHWIPAVLVVVLGTNNGGLDMMTKSLWTLLPIEINGVDSFLDDIAVTMEKKCKKDDLRLSVRLIR